MFFPSSVHLGPAGEDQYASEDSGTLVGRGTKEGYTTKMGPLPSECSDELKHVT